MIKVYRQGERNIPEHQNTGKLYTRKTKAIAEAERYPTFGAVIRHENFGPYNETFFEPVFLVNEKTIGGYNER